MSMLLCIPADPFAKCLHDDTHACLSGGEGGGGGEGGDGEGGGGEGKACTPDGPQTHSGSRLENVQSSCRSCSTLAPRRTVAR